MHYKIAELIVAIPEEGGLPPLFWDYRCEEACDPDIIIHTEKYNRALYADCMSEESVAYMESGRQFFSKLLKHSGFYLHASAVEMNGRAYLFSGPCGTGKSTHTRLWQKTFGEAARVFNDDKPALRCLDGRWYAYGSPWSGKDHININMKVPLAGICFLKQAPENRIRRLCMGEAATQIIQQTFRTFQRTELLDLSLSCIDKLVKEIPVFELENRPDEAAARLSYETIKQAAMEAGL